MPCKADKPFAKRIIPDTSDILADYRQWRSMQEDRIGTHSEDCHLWPRHERCMIHRLAAEVERLRQVLSQENTPN